MIFLTGKMNEQSYTNQEITEYLLGSLPAGKVELFDELSLTDDQFSGALDVAEHELLDAYARGELGGATLANFKSHYLASPLRREKVDFAETWRTYEKRNEDEKSENFVQIQENPAQTRGGFFRLLKIFTDRRSPVRAGFSFAALLLLIIVGIWFLKNRSNDETAKQSAPSNIQIEPSNQIPSAVSNEQIAAVNAPVETASPPPENAPPKKNSNAQTTRPPAPEKTIEPPKISIASFMLPPPVRGGGQLKNLSIPAGTAGVDIKLALETDDFPVYRVALTNESGSVRLWNSGAVKASKGENKYLNVRFSAGLLKSKIYTLVVSGINTSGEEEIIGNYVFRSVIK